MAQRVFVTGASGFVGSAIVAELLSRGHAVMALSHRREVASAGRVGIVTGDLFDQRVLDEGMRDCTAVIHLVGIIMERPSRGTTFEHIHVEGTKSVVDAAKRAGIRRFIHMSALGTRVGAVSRYHKTKYEAEEYVRRSGLEWTIFRPSMIHGPDGEFMRMEAKWARMKAPPFLFMPYFGAGAMGRGGAGMLQPVHVKDVARAFADALEKQEPIGEVYPMGGAQRVSWAELHRISAQAIVGRRRWVMALPAWYARMLTRIVSGALLPFNEDQVIMTQEDNTCDTSKFVADFGWEPRGFEETLKEYAKRL